ncbi:peptidoglycan-binding protein [Shewanella putrefaciens]
MRVQISLLRNGYNIGAIDGLMGPSTSLALKSYQKDMGLKVTGTMTTETLTSLGVSLP